MIGLFLGDSDFSEIVLKKIKKLKKKYFIIDFSRNNKFKKDKNSYRISIGKFGKILNLIKEKKSNKVLFAGKIAKPKFSSLRLDLKGFFYIKRIIKSSKLGDAAIIKEIINILKVEKIKVINSLFFNDDLSLRLLKQAARELLLSESSDWSFILRAGTTTELAKERIDRHLFRFWKLVEMIKNESNISLKFLEDIEEEDKVFPDINIDDWRK